MLVISKPAQVPHGGYWKYKDPDTGFAARHPYLHHLEKVVRDHREGNALSYDPTAFVQIICRETGNDCCHESDNRAANATEMLRNFAIAMGEWAKTGFALADPSIRLSRFNKCKDCTFWGGSTGPSLVLGRCKKCGCRGVKLSLASSRCPLGRW